MTAAELAAQSVRHPTFGLPKDDFVSRMGGRISGPTSSGCWEWTGTKNNMGYPQMGFTVAGKKRIRYVHRMMYEAAYGSLPKGMNVCHECDNPACVNPAHLFLGTQLQNMQDMARKGRANGLYGRKPPRGEENQAAKLRAPQVMEIRRLARLGVPRRVLQDRFGVSNPTIADIIVGRTWKHLEDQQ